MSAIVPYRRKRVGGMRRKRPAYRRRRIMTRAKVPANFLSCKRTERITSIYYETSTGLWVNDKSNEQFKLNDLTNFAEFQNLFDAYRICGVKLQFIPRYNTGDANMAPATDGAALTSLLIVQDDDSAPSVPNEAALLQYSTSKRLYLDKVRNFYVKNPRVANAVYSSSITTAYGEGKRNQWIDCSYPNVEHYGVRWWMDTAGLSKNWGCDIYATYYLQFKHVI